jgi:sigma-B regulation protein RsbU (phosphoserine phosphatase)
MLNKELEEALYQKQLQINCILNITQAINNNDSAEELFEKYLAFLTRELSVGNMLFLVNEEQNWSVAASYNNNSSTNLTQTPEVFLEYKHIAKLSEIKHPALEDISFIIPIKHKKIPIAYVFIGFHDEGIDEYNRIKFITTLSNIIAVAIENKRLFKKQMEQEGLKKEMEVASQVQKMLIPNTLPSNESYLVSTIYQPHTNVGGDFISCVEQENNNLALCVADVSGKGVPAALLMANFQAVYQSASRQFNQLKSMSEYMNHQIHSLTRGERFITSFFGNYCTQSGTLRYCNAGHNPPILLQEGKFELLKVGTTLLGAFEELPFLEIGEVLIKPGATLLCYTDGLTEIQNDKGEYYQEYRLIEFMERNAHLQSHALNDLLLKEIQDFKKEVAYSDDIAVLTLNFFPNKVLQPSLM